MNAIKAALLVCVLSTSAYAAPDPNCWITRKWPSPRTIPVYVSTNVTEGVARAGYDSTFVDAATRIAVARWNEQGGSQLRLKFMGETTLTRAQQGNAVVVVGSATCSRFIATGSSTQYPNNPLIAGSGTVTLIWKSLVDGTTNVCTSYTHLEHQSYAGRPDTFVDVMTHELGHVLGRLDAYPYGDNAANPQCGLDHPTIMNGSPETFQDLTDFDRTDTQATYGSRMVTDFTHLWRRQQGATTATDEGTGEWDVAPAPGSSYQPGAIPVSLVHPAYYIASIVARSFSALGRWAGTGSDWNLGSYSYYSHKPASVSYGPNGDGVAAYIVETPTTGGQRVVCYQRKSGTNWTNPICLEEGNICRPTRNSISTAYDPVSGRFLMAYQCDEYIARIHAFSVPDCTDPSCQEIFMDTSGITAAETPVLACSPMDASLGGVTEPHSNCRIVYARANTVGQKLAWRYLGIVPSADPATAPSFSLGSENAVSGIESDHAPAVTWFVDRFRMALTVDDSRIEMYSMLPTQPVWVFTERVNPDPYGENSWISTPFLSGTMFCRYGFPCTEKLWMFWLRYNKPCTVGSTPTTCGAPVD